MNGKMKDEMTTAIQRVMDRYCEDSGRWPDSYCPPHLADRMVIFDAVFEATEAQELELK